MIKTLDVESGKLSICKMDHTTTAVFARMIQNYESEFSSVTNKKPNHEGIFALDTPIDDGHCVFVAMYESIPCGFNVVHLKGNNCFEVCEFFVVPVFRKQKIGFLLAQHGFETFPGAWEVKQI